MKSFFNIMVGALAVMMVSCSNSDLYDSMPQEISQFISQYYPNSQLADFTSTDDSYTVVIKDGPTLVFDIKCNWTHIDGNGSTLPQTLLFNDLPPDLYNYLQETENTANVFMIARNTRTYTVKLLVDTLTYDIESGIITGSEGKEESATNN